MKIVRVCLAILLAGLIVSIFVLWTSANQKQGPEMPDLIKLSSADIDLVNSLTPDDREWEVSIVITNSSGIRLASVKSVETNSVRQLVLSSENLNVGDRVRLSHVSFAKVVPAKPR